MSSDNNILNVLNCYFEIRSNSLDESNITYHAIKTGLIHSSYRVSTPEGDWLLQKVNTDVFRDLIGLMHNIELVTDVLSKTFQGGQYETLKLKKNKNGESYTVVNNVAWRIYGFKADLKGYNTPASTHMIHEAGKAFAAFTEALSEINPTRLAITIPKFHSLKHRYEQLQLARSASKGLGEDVQKLLNRVNEHYPQLVKLEDAFLSGELPTRVTHNDAKFNNLLFDSKGNARCVVDLDTIMPGIIHFDIGDCLRTLVPNISEDSPNVDSLVLNSSFEKAFIDGYLEAASTWITDTERNFLPFSGPYMALIMGMRFLADHLNGNVYFSCEHPQHNMDRARNQLELVHRWRTEKT